MATKLTKTQEAKIRNCLKIPKGCPENDNLGFMKQVCVSGNTVYATNSYLIVRVRGIDTSQLENIHAMTDEEHDMLESLFSFSDEKEKTTLQSSKYNPAVAGMVLDVFKAFNEFPCMEQKANRTICSGGRGKITAVYMAVR